MSCCCVKKKKKGQATAGQSQNEVEKLDSASLREHPSFFEEGDEETQDGFSEMGSVRTFGESPLMSPGSSGSGASNSMSNLATGTSICDDSKFSQSQRRSTVRTVFRRQLPVPRPNADFSLWEILKSVIGKDLTKISMPVALNEPLSFLQKLAEYMEYSHLLDVAVKSHNNMERMEYITAFLVSGMSNTHERITKPFNPLLGETFEYARPDLGFRFVGEQVSHHPPLSSFHVEGRGYTFFGCVQPKIKFWGRAIEAYPNGTMYLKIQESNEIYTWHWPPIAVKNIYYGKMFLQISGKMVIEKFNDNTKAVVHFKQAPWTGKDNYVEATLYNKSGTKSKVVYGNWTRGLYSCTSEEFEEVNESGPKRRASRKSSPEINISACPSFSMEIPRQRLVWKVNPRPPDAKEHFDFTSFAVTLNEMTSDLKGTPLNVCPTDSRYRPDIRYLEMGNPDMASQEKERLENKQRAAKKNGVIYKPKWFVQRRESITQNEEWLFNGLYWKKNWDGCPNIF